MIFPIIMRSIRCLDQWMRWNNWSRKQRKEICIFWWILLWIIVPVNMNGSKKRCRTRMVNMERISISKMAKMGSRRRTGGLILVGVSGRKFRGMIISFICIRLRRNSQILTGRMRLSVRRFMRWSAGGWILDFPGFGLMRSWILRKIWRGAI